MWKAILTLCLCSLRKFRKIENFHRKQTRVMCTSGFDALEMLANWTLTCWNVASKYQDFWSTGTVKRNSGRQLYDMHVYWQLRWSKCTIDHSLKVDNITGTTFKYQHGQKSGSPANQQLNSRRIKLAKVIPGVSHIYFAFQGLQFSKNSSYSQPRDFHFHSLVSLEIQRQPRDS